MQPERSELKRPSARLNGFRVKSGMTPSVGEVVDLAGQQSADASSASRTDLRDTALILSARQGRASQEGSGIFLTRLAAA